MDNLQSLCFVLFIAMLVHSAHSFSTDDSVLSATLDINPGAPKTRGNKFALAFMNNHNRPNTGPDGARTSNEIGLFITTEQESSTFTIQTRFAGVAGRGFTETSPGSGLYTRTEIATRGSFTFVNLPAGGGTVPDIAVQNNGQNSVPDQRKGVIIEAVDSTHELTIYVLNDEDISTDAYMAINCVEFPSARDYQYFVFSSDYDEAGGENFQSRFLITPCEDDTEVSVRPSLTLSHPGWVSPAPPNTNPASTTGQDESDYGRLFDRFDTLMLEANDDLTGSIITSDKPLSVFVGHQCGTPVDVGTCDYLVEQIPPHPTYGDLFFMAPFAVRQSGELYRIGSITNGVQVTITCDCTADSGSGNRVALESSTTGVYTATVNRGQYVQCRTPENMQSYCCVQSTQPVTMMSYTLGNLVDDLSNLPNLPFDPIADPAMVYIPPAINYLNSYSLSTAKNLTKSFQGYVSYILPERIFSNSVQDQNRLTVNGEVYIPDDGYTAINCQVDGSSDVCAYGATRFLGQGNFEIDYTNIGTGAFWGFAYGYAREVSFAYPLAFEMAPVGLAWVVARNHVVIESDITVNLGFLITRGDRSVRTRAFAYTDGGTATAGVDYVSAGTRPGGGGNSNLRFQRARNTPSNDLTVTILDDDEPEADEVIVIRVECEPLENCYTPITEYTITIEDDDGGATTPLSPTCSDLPELANAVISYDMDPPDARPEGTVATYQCNAGYMLVGETTRTCQGTGMFDGMPPSCQQIINIMFTMDVFSFNENGGSGFVEVSVNQAPDQSFDFTLGSVSTFNEQFVQVSAGSLPATFTFPAGQTSVMVSFSLTDDIIGLEDLETYDVTLGVSSAAMSAGVSLGARSMAIVQVMDDDAVTLSVGELTYSVAEDAGPLEVSYILNREAIREVSFDVVNIDGTATGGGVDYNFAGYSLTIPAGSTDVSRSISITDDGVPGEEDETFTNRIDNIVTADVVLGDAESTVTIQDASNDVTVMFGAATYSFSESGDIGTIEVVTSAPAPFDFDFTVSGGPSAQEFVVNSGGSINVQDSFTMGDTSFTIEIPLTDDSTALEDLESFVASLTLATGTQAGVVLGTPSMATIQISDDDAYTVGFASETGTVSESAGPATLSIVSTPAARPVTLSVGTTSGGSATPDGDYTATGSIMVTIPAGQTTSSFSVDITDDSIVEGNEDFIGEIFSASAGAGVGPLTISPQQSTITILDDDVATVSFSDAVYSFDEGSGTGSVTIVKNGEVAFPFDIIVSGGPSQQSGITVNADGIDGTVTRTFPPDQQSLTIEFNIGDDEIGLEELESYIATLEVVGSPFGVSAGPITSTEVQVMDDDAVSVGFGSAGITVTETDGQFTMCVRLNRAAAVNVTVTLETQDGTAIDGEDYNASSIPSELVISAGSTEECFMGDIIDDGVPGEPPENFMITITSVGPDGVTISRDTTVITITDTDPDGTCPALPDLLNGRIEYSEEGSPGFPNGTVATHTCNTGYVLNGESTRTCEVAEMSATGEFDGVAPVCDPVCDQLPDIANGMISYSPDMVAPYSVSTVATYSCNEGYELTGPGDEMRTCRDNGDGSGGDFDGTAPTCEPMCDQLSAIANGVISYASDMVAPYSMATVATYSCNEGYELTGPGNEMRTCRDNGDGSGGDFDGTAPTCEPVCDQLPDIANGVISYASDMVAPYSVATVATYSCNEGYELTGPGNEMRTCRDNGDGSGGDFDGTAPTCEPVCDQLSAIVNGVISYSPDMVAPYSVSTVATYSCNEGYILRMGDEMRTCRDNGDGSGGDFDGTAPTCESQCPPLPAIMNGMISYGPDSTPDYDVGTVATYVCDDGFFLIGDSTRECQSDRSFSGAPPVCSMIPVCPELPPIANGMIAYSVDETPRPIATVATYTCNDGFFRNGVMTRTCVEVGNTGMFDQEAPTCDPIECDPLDPLVNGVITYSPDTVPDYELNTVADHMCNHGFRLVGPQTRVCEDVGGPDGEFTQQPPVCEADGTCPALPDLLNGRIEYSELGSPGFPDGTVATHICNTGYVLNGASTRTCEVAEMSLTGEFDGEAPVCDPICDQLSAIANGMISYSPDMVAPYSVATVATYSCNEGYELTGPGNEMRTCRDNGDGSGGDFDGTAPTCEPVCDQLPDMAYGMISYASDMVAPYSVATVATYSCNEDYILRMGDEMRTCRDNGDGSGGDFDGTAPTCESQCPPLPAIMNGMISYGPDSTPDYDVGTVATYVCDEGFLLIGDSTRECQSDRTFSGAPPVCSMIPVCPELPAIANGMIEYNMNETPRPIGTVATYTCNDGFFRNGVMTRTCVEVGNTGMFDQEAPTCNSIECDPLDPLVNGIITYSPDTVPDYELGTVADHMCNSGFRLVGPHMRVCEDVGGPDGEFNQQPPVCELGCNSEVYLNYTWPDTQVDFTVSIPCPCGEFLGVFAGEMSRYCMRTPQGAKWSNKVNMSSCEITISQVSQQLCDIAMGLSQNETVQTSEQVVNITSTLNLTSNQITVATTVLERLTIEAATNSEVRDNYLQTIDNIQQSDPEVLMESQRTMNSTTRILNNLETFVDSLVLDTVTQNSSINRTALSFRTFALQVEDVNINSFNGQTFTVALGSVEQARNNSERIDQDALITEDGVKEKEEKEKLDDEDIEEATAVLQLHPALFEECVTNSSSQSAVTQRLSYSVFLTDALFLPENGTLNRVGSIVLAARIRCQAVNRTMFSTPIQTSFQITDIDEVIESSCAVYNTKDGFGAWDSDGCKEITRADGRVDCECTQLGHFGILLDLNPTALSEELSIALSAITFVGLTLSLICLAVFIFTNLMSKKLRANPHNHVLVNMGISLGGLYITFLVGGFPTNIPPLCGVVSALLHFFFLAFFAWTAVEAVWLYLKLVKVFGAQSLTSRYTLKAGIPAWVLPAVIVIISVGAGHQYYISRYYCRPTEWPFFFGLILPFLAVYVFNWIMFLAIMVSICRHTRHMSTHREPESGVLNARDLKKNFIIAMCLAVVLGLGWGFGLAATSSDLEELTFTFQVVFSIFVGSQGVLIFVFHGIRNTDFRDFWKKPFISEPLTESKFTFSSEKSNTGKRFVTDQESIALSTLPRKIKQ